MLISKKDLLAITGISYGQLYRWKRERLIPEEWFIKQSSYTGQETFFPREQILSRIRSIQELKDKYSLEELARILSPEVADKNFKKDDLSQIEEIDPGLLETFTEVFGKEEYTYLEIILMVMISETVKKGELPEEYAAGIAVNLKHALSRLKTTGAVLCIFKVLDEYFGVFYPDQAQVILDARFEEAAQVRMDEVSNRIKLKYKNRFQFM